MPFYSERERGPRARTTEDIGKTPWDGIVSVIQTRVDDGSFGMAYPEVCPDGNAICGVNKESFNSAISSLALPWPPGYGSVPGVLDVLDLIEFCYEKVSKSQRNADDYHSYYRHYHLSFDQEAGKKGFREEINRIFSRNGIAYELGLDGHIKRLAPIVLGDALAVAVFRTNDRLLDELLETARAKFLQPKPAIRQEALEKLWDAWERMKTLEDPAHKKNSIGLILDKTSPESAFRVLLEAEAKTLTDIGNSFTIRHTEVGKTEIRSSEQVDYLFHRMFALIRLVLRATGRGG